MIVDNSAYASLAAWESCLQPLTYLDNAGGTGHHTKTEANDNRVEHNPELQHVGDDKRLALECVYERRRLELMVAVVLALLLARVLSMVMAVMRVLVVIRIGVLILYSVRVVL